MEAKHLRNTSLYFIILITLGILVISSALKLDRVVEIDDIHILYEKKNKIYPISIDLIDEVWGTSTIDDEKIIFQIVDNLRKLPVSTDEFTEELTRSESRDIGGVINYLGGSRGYFSLGKVMELDGIKYGDRYSLYNVLLIKKALINSIYTTSNLQRLINSFNHVIIVSHEGKYSLGEKDKLKLAKEIEKVKEIESSGQFNKLFKDRGEVVYQIQIFIGDEGYSPQVYIVVYENQIAAVYDAGNYVGAIMYLQGKLSEFLDNLSEEYLLR